MSSEHIDAILRCMMTSCLDPMQTPTLLKVLLAVDGAGQRARESSTIAFLFHTDIYKTLVFYITTMKRALDDDSANNELEEGEEYEEHHPIAGPSTFTLPPPPPPPPLLRLVVHHSSQNPSANLLPPHQTLALIQETTTIGRDKSYEPRIRLKTLEVSRTHATIFQQEEQAHSNQYSDGSEADSSDDTGNWFIVDNASTHGTYIRRLGEEQYTRLSEKGQSSLPRQLKHME